jgi:hypothetical protein
MGIRHTTCLTAVHTTAILNDYLFLENFLLLGGLWTGRKTLGYDRHADTLMQNVIFNVFVFLGHSRWN